MGALLDRFDEVVVGHCGSTLTAWVLAGAWLDDEPVRCPVTSTDQAARARLDLALRMLRGQPMTQWCRALGDGAAVVRSWPLPARAVTVHDDDGAVTAMVLAVGRSGGRADLWRCRVDVPGVAVLDRALALVA